MLLLLRFFTFFYVFSKPKKSRLFTFFAVLRTFSRTMFSTLQIMTGIFADSSITNSVCSGVLFNYKEYFNSITARQTVAV